MWRFYEIQNSVSRNSFTGIQPHSFMYSMVDKLLELRICERPYGPESIKFFVSGPLQKKLDSLFATKKTD